MTDADAKRQWVTTVLGFRFADAEADPDDEPVTTAQLTSRLKALQSFAGGGGEFDHIVGQLRQVAQAVRDRGVGADEEVEMLEQHVAEISATQADRELAGDTYEMTRQAEDQDARLTRMRAAAAAARSAVELAAETLSEACVVHAASLKAAKERQSIVSGDEDEIMAAAEAAGDSVPSFDETANMLDDLFEEYESAEDEVQQQQLLDEASQAIASFRASLTDPLLTEMEETDSGSYQIMSAIEEALSDLDRALRL